MTVSEKPVARDMSKLDWRGLLSGLFKFLREEMREPEHADDDVVHDEWREGDHPRGNPDNPGEFSGTGGSKKPRPPPGTVKSLKLYTGPAGAEINAAVRDGRGETLSEEQRAAVATLDRAMAASPGLSKETQVYRGVQVPDGTTFEVGQELSDPSFMSTSTNIHVAHSYAGSSGVHPKKPGHTPVIISMRLPAGTKSLEPNSFAGGNAFAKAAGNSEVLLPRESKFRVTGVENKTVTHNRVWGPEHQQLQVVTAELVSEKNAAQDAQPGLATSPSAASVAFVAPTRRILFVRRGRKETNYPGYWAWPGGKADDGEGARGCALREAREEIGEQAHDEMRELDKKRTEHGWDHTTFLALTPEEFEPKLNGEHDDYRWALPDDPPEPLHPGVASTLEGFGDRIETLTEAEDDSSVSELGTALRGPGAIARQIPKNPIGKDGDLKITHQIDDTPMSDEANRGTPDVGRMSREVRRDRSDHSVRRTGTAMDVRMAEDRAILAFDRDSVREKDVDGRMRVSVANISKANICPYIGKEIPSWKELGLDPDKRYNLLRDPEELARAAPSFNSLPILSKHQPVDARSHPPELVIGATGTDSEFGAPYLTNSLVFWPQAAIDSIENDDHRQLSAAYRYDADMTPGTYEGRPYDGVMRNIVGNHVALVREGRAGNDVVVGDEMPRGWTAPKWRVPEMAQGWRTPRWTSGMAMDAVVAMDPLTGKGEKIMGSMKDKYGEEKGERVFYASRNKGTIKGVDQRRIGKDVGAESTVNGKRTGYRISTDADWDEGKHKRDHGKFSSGGGSSGASGGGAKSSGASSGKVTKSGKGPAGKIDLVHGVTLSDKTRGGRAVTRENQVAVRTTGPDGKVSHTYFGNADKPGNVRAAEKHHDFMTGGSSGATGGAGGGKSKEEQDRDWAELHRQNHVNYHRRLRQGGGQIGEGGSAGAGKSGGERNPPPVPGKRAEAVHEALSQHGFEHKGEMGGAAGEGWHMYHHPSGGYMHVNHATGEYRSVSPKRNSLPGGRGGKAILRHLGSNYPEGAWKQWEGSGPEYWESRR